MDYEFGFEVILRNYTVPIYYLNHIPKQQIELL